jgi:hypothetical protein
MGIAQHIIHWNCNHIFTAYIYIHTPNPQRMDGLGWVHIPENNPSMASLNALTKSPSFRNWGNAPKEPQHRQEAVDSSHGSLRLMARRWPRHTGRSSEISRSHKVCANKGKAQISREIYAMSFSVLVGWSIEGFTLPWNQWLTDFKWF